MATAALISAAVVKKNRSSFAKTVLLNNKKVKNFHQDPNDTNYTLLYYLRNENDREVRDEYKVALTVAQVDAKVREEGNEPVIPLYVNKRRPKFGNSKVLNSVRYINVEDWVIAWDNSNGTTATVWIEEGAFKLVELQVNHTIAQIEARASTSASFSESGI